LARVRLLLLVGLLFAASPVGSALADSTIGQVGADPNGTCVTGDLVVADTNYVVPPGGGVISSFSFQSDSQNTGQQLDFLVLRPGGGDSYTVVGKTGLVTLKGTQSGTVETFPAGIVVQAGDILGLWIPSRLNACVRGASSGGGGFISSAADVESDPNVGQTLSHPGARTNIDLNESANLVTASHTIGQVGGSSGPNGCLGPVVLADTTYVVPPGGGFITSFSFQSGPGNEGQQLDFLVLRPTGGGNYTVIGQTGLVTLTGTTVETFPASIAVQGGDILGLWYPNGFRSCVRPVNGPNVIASDLDVSDPNVGQTLSLSTPDELDLNESANLVTVGLGSPPPPPPVPTTSTSTTLGAPTTTTTTIPACTTALDCLGRVKDSIDCPGGLDPKLGSFIDKKHGAASAKLTKAEAKPTKATKFGKQAKILLTAIDHKAGVLAKRKKKPISAACRDSVNAAVAPVVQAIAAGKL
jgi:hypothetical protein